MRPRLAYRNLDPRFGLRIATVRPRAFAYVTDRTGRTRWVVEYDDGGHGYGAGSVGYI